jgi:hypothetical protein
MLNLDLIGALVLEPTNNLLKADLQKVEKLLDGTTSEVPRRKRIEIEEIGVAQLPQTVKDPVAPLTATPIQEVDAKEDRTTTMASERDLALTQAVAAESVSVATPVAAEIVSVAAPVAEAAPAISYVPKPSAEFDVPKSLIDFEMEWKNRKESKVDLYKYLKVLPFNPGDPSFQLLCYFQKSARNPVLVCNH